MILRLKNFRKWTDYEVELSPNGVTLLKGKSGSGKSTLFNAIYWCLYGTLKKVSPNGTTKLTTSVSLQLDNLLIVRRTNPAQLEVTFNQTKYESVPAQVFINERFGSSEVWQSSCYVSQGMRNYFLSLTNASKMDLLHSIAFHEEDPSEKIIRLNDLLKEQKDNHTNLLKAYQELETLWKGLPINEYSASYIVSVEKLDELRLQQQVVEKVLSEQKSKLPIVNEWKRQIAKIEESLSFLIKPEKPIMDARISQLIEEESIINIEDVQRYLQICESIKALQKDLTKFPHETYQDFTPNDLLLASDITMNIEKERTIAKFNNVDYQRDVIEAKIKELTLHLNCQQAYRNFSQCQRLERQIKEITILEIPVCPNFTVKDLEHANKQEVEYRREQEIISQLSIRREDIEAEKLRLTSQLERQPSLQASLRRKEIIHELDVIGKEKDLCLTGALDFLIKETIVKIETLRTRISLACDHTFVSCPSCSSKLVYQKGKLFNELPISDFNELVERQQLTVEEQLLKQKELELANVKQRKSQLQWKEEALRKELSEITFTEDTDEVPLTSSEKDQVRKRLFALNSLNLIEKPEPSANEIREHLRNKELFDINERKKAELSKLTDELSQLVTLERKEGPIYSDKEICDVNNIIGCLSGLKFPDIPKWSVSFIKDELSKKERSQQSTAITQQIVKLQQELGGRSEAKLMIIKNGLLNFHEEEKRYLQDEQNYQTKINFLQKDLSELKAKLCSMEQLEVEIAEGEKQLSAIQQAIISHERSSYMNNVYQMMSLRYSELASSSNIISKGEQLKQILTVCECQLLSDTVSNINVSIQQTCQEFFNEEINIRLDLFKTLKSTGREKPTVNFNIHYQGIDFDSIVQLSGGEGDRVSLALTIALNKLSNFPFLFLDESLASLDHDVKCNVIETLREHTDHGVIAIMHDGVEGIFDHTIEL